jgi:hypothetical protein
VPEHAEFLLAADKGRERASAAPSAAPAGANDAEELDRSRNALEFARALLFGDEETRDLSLDVHGDEHRARISRGLNAGGNVRRVAEHLACRFYNDGPRLDADARRQLGCAFGSVPSVYVSESPLDRKRGAHRPLGVILLRLRIAEERHQPVAQPLEDMAAEPGHGLRRLVEVSVDQVAPVLGVELRRHARRSDQVAEHHRDWATLGRDLGALDRRRL